MKTKKKPARKTRKPVPEQFNPAKPLKLPMQEAFCQNLAHGDGIIRTKQGGYARCEIAQSEAYINAGYKARGASADAHASRLVRDGKIAARLDFLREKQEKELEKRGIATKEEVCTILTELLRARHSDFLSMGEDGVTMFDIGPETLNQAALKKIKTRIQRDESGNVMIERQFDEIELESKVTAAKALADIMGWNKADENAGDFNSMCRELIDQLAPPVPESERSPITG